ncbi:MAG: MetQ/NlpA family ABC transporter substrate-binding protein [Lachnospirales bacterium]
MKKNNKIAILLLVMIFTMAIFTGCSSQSADTASGDANKTEFTIGCMPLNEPAVQEIAKLMEPMGYTVEIKVFDGNNLPAIALKDGDIDSLMLNHLPWINTFNEENSSELVMVEPYLYASLFGLYSDKHKSIEEFPDGATIIVSNDPSNMQRSLEFLQDLGFIKLGEKTGDFYTVLDIAENYKNINLVEVETTATASSFKDADGSISFTSVMRNAGIDPSSYLAEDGKYVDFPTGPVVNKGNEDQQWVQDMMTVVQSEEFEAKFNEIFEGAYVLFSDMK